MGNIQDNNIKLKGLASAGGDWLQSLMNREAIASTQGVRV